MTSAELSPTPRSTIQRGKHRASRNRSDLYAVLDAGLVCHLGVSVDGEVRVLPSGYGRIGDTLYLHGSTGARWAREAPDSEVCVTVCLLDGIVYARAVLHFSMNYRSVMVHGRPRVVTDTDEHRRGLRAIVEHLAPGAWEHARPPTKRELAKTAVLALDLTEAAVKFRAGGPNDDAADIDREAAWAGVVPLHRAWGEPEPAADLATRVEVPAHVLDRPQPG